MQGSKQKKTAVAFAIVLAVAIALTGTFAWMSISQTKVNENLLEANPGGRIHDDFDGSNKDVYAENFTSAADNGRAVFVRIRLDEYMETGKNAGIKTTDTAGDSSAETDTTEETESATPLIFGTDINDTDTWITYKPDADSKPFRDYWYWGTGGSTVYMPTFNKNKDSLAVDGNGSYEGITEGDNVHFDDYVTYEEYETKQADAYYDADDNDDDEDSTKPGNGGTEDVNYTSAEETHTATVTQSAVVLTMQEWMDKGSPVGNYWVWDTDGWAYWAEPLEPGEATGCLLNYVQPTVSLGDNCYYAINVVGQFASANDWGTKGDPDSGTESTGFYIDGITDNALALLNQAASVKTDAEGNKYLSNGANTYKMILDDTGSLGDPICAGSDMMIGTEDDRDDVIELTDALTIDEDSYGTLFLPPDDTSDAYRAVGSDGMLGTADDVKIWHTGSAAFPDGELSLVGVNKVIVTAASNATSVNANSTLQFTATCYLNTVAMTNEGVVWSVSGNVKDDTTIDKNGLLTVSLYETGETLTITATSKSNPDAAGTAEVSVVQSSIIDIRDMETFGSKATVTIDGNVYYVLAKDVENNRALIMKQTYVLKMAFSADGSTNVWRDSDVRTYLANTWLPSQPTLNTAAATVEIKTRAAYSSQDFITTEDRVFLLSEADLWGTFQKSETDVLDDDYTAGGPLPMSGIGGDGKTAGWLRSPYYTGNTLPEAAHWASSGAREPKTYVTYSNGWICPVMWINLDS